MPLFDIENEYFNRANPRNRYRKKELFGEAVEPTFSNKMGLFERKEMFVNFGLYEKVHNFFYNRRERKLDKILKELTDNVNVLPRGYGSLPANKNRSLNGYYNFKYANVPGNDEYINKRLFYNELQIIDEAVYEAKPKLIKLCGNDPKLIKKVEQRIADLHIRPVEYNKARTGEPFDKKGLFDIEVRLGNQKALIALASNKGLNAPQENKINDLLVRAESYLGENRTAKEKEQMSKVFEELNVYLRDNEPNMELGMKNAPSEHRTPLADRVLAFTKENEQNHSEHTTGQEMKAGGKKEIATSMTVKERE